MLAGTRFQEGFRLWREAMAATPWRPAGPRPLDDIRLAMLDALGDPASAGRQQAAVLRLRHWVRSCHDGKSLWYLRSDLMQVLSERAGELQARQALEDIDAMFQGLLPAGLQSRPASLR